jgi:hypothetical protein
VGHSLDPGGPQQLLFGVRIGNPLSGFGLLDSMEITVFFTIEYDFVFSNAEGNSLSVLIDTGEFIFSRATLCSGTGARLRGTRLAFSAVCQEDPSLKIRVTEQKNATASVLFYEQGSHKPVLSFVLQPEN